MQSVVRNTTYSTRAWLVAIFVALAFMLGGGGTPNPATELLLEMAFVAIALAWLWLPSAKCTRASNCTDPFVFALAAIPLIIPVVQLIPLSPAIWTRFPGRQNEFAALSLIGQQSSWRSMSLSPNRTLASLLSIIPAVFCLYAVARLTVRERRLVLVAVVLMSVISALLGAIQLTAGGRGINLYPEHHVGWVTGFQANRNAAADVLLIGILALAALAAPYLVGIRKRLPIGLGRGGFAVLVGGMALLLVAAAVMTGSRAGTALVLLVGAAVTLILSVSRTERRNDISKKMLLLAVAASLFGCVAVFGALSQNTAIGRVEQRFSELGSERDALWQDSWFTLKQYWPVGFGIGGFQPAMLPAERLEVLDPQVPNRAHNDYLEMGIEAGILGYALLAAAAGVCMAIAWRSWRDEPALRPHVVFGMSVLLLIGLHSIVDYPLRSMAIACLAGVAAGTMVRKTVSRRDSVVFRSANPVKDVA